ncbi:MAG: MCP four helix bundle domain-containing protein, partial [Aeromonas sobria]
MNNLIRQFSIKVRLIISFLLVNLILIGVGLYGKQNTSVINDMLNEMYINNLTPIKDLANANMQAIYHNRSLFDYVIEPTQAGMDNIAREMDGYEQQMQGLLNKYRATELTDTEKTTLAQADRAWPIYKESAKKAMAASYANDNDAAVKLMKGEAAANFKVLDDQLSQLVEFNEQLGTKAYKDSDVIVADLTATTYTILTISVILSLLLGWLLSNSINQPLVSIMEEIKQLAAGYLTAKDNSEGNDELTQMQLSMINARRSLRDIVSTMQHAAEGLTASSSQLVAAAQQVNTSSQQQSLATANTAASVEELTTS